MAFDAPAVLALAPVIGGFVWFAAAWSRRVRLRRASRWSPATAQVARSAGRFGPTSVSVAAFLGAVALAGPRWGEERIQAETRGLNLVFAVDISRSMLAEDAGGSSRLARALREARRLAQDLDGDRLGLVAFAGASYILSPLSVDGSALTLYLDALDPDVASRGSTALGPALQMGGELLGTESPLADRVLVVFTDGEAHDSAGATLAIAQRLGVDGIRLILVAEGSGVPARIPRRDERGALLGYQLDEAGQEIGTRRRDDILDAVADAAHGTIVAAELPDQAGAVRDLVASYKRSRSTASSTQHGRPRGWIPVVGAVVILLGQALSRRTAALLALLGVLALADMAAQAQPSPQRRSAAERAWDRGDSMAARDEYLAELGLRCLVCPLGMGDLTVEGVPTRGNGDTAWFNAGTAALAAGDLATARGALAHASTSLDPEVRFRALYNEGLLALRAAQIDSVNRDAHLGEAERAYREALLLQPHHLAAKWNLELAQRRRGQGGGSSQRPPSGGQGGQPPSGQGSGQPPPPTSGQAMTQAQAEEILRSIGHEELRTRRDRSGRVRRAAEPRVKDW
ncbi:MAG: VWA domain-containing protein [Gemmatimonadales bacterium]